MTVHGGELQLEMSPPQPQRIPSTDWNAQHDMLRFQNKSSILWPREQGQEQVQSRETPDALGIFAFWPLSYRMSF